MKYLTLLGLSLLLLGLSAGGLQAASLLAPDKLAIGQPAVITIEVQQVALPLLAEFQERNFTLYSLPNGQGYTGMIGADLKTEPGEYILAIKGQNGLLIDHKAIQVVDHDYGTRNITVEEKFVEFDDATLARIKEENQRQAAVYTTYTLERHWQGAFIKPLNSVVVGKFGRKSIINGQPRSPHGGVDLRGAVGTPIKAPADGRVALTMDSYFSGKLVLIDHGQGLVSAYRHLSKISVQEGQMLRQGETLGLVGATGRVTGPHLHFDIHLQNATIDPLAFIELSKNIAKNLQEKSK